MKHVGIDPQILRNLRFADARLTCEPNRLAFEFIRKLPSFHLTPPIVNHILSNVSVLSGEAQSFLNNSTDTRLKSCHRVSEDIKIIAALSCVYFRMESGKATSQRNEIERDRMNLFSKGEHHAFK